MHKRVVISQVHRMGRVENIEILKVLPLMEVKALGRSTDMNRSPEKSLMLGSYRRKIPSTNFARPHD
jgi:hypothetical protein